MIKNEKETPLTLKERMQQALETSRGFTERLLADFDTPDQWLTTGVEGGNHPLWIAGHLAVADNAFVNLVSADRSQPRESYRKWFGKGSRPLHAIDEYDAPPEILEYMRERRSTLLNVLADMPEERFNTPLPENSPKIMHDFGSVFHMAAWHEALHAGQLTVIRRCLGLGPVNG